jgi:predicted amidohydrolase
MRFNMRRTAVLLSCLATFLPCLPAAAGALTLDRSEGWTPEPIAAPRIQQADGRVTIRANGTRTCCGGWQFVYSGVRPGQAYRIQTRVEHQDVDHPLDSLVAVVLWDRWEPTEADTKIRLFNYLAPQRDGADRTAFQALLVAPEGAKQLTVRYTFRWSLRGTSCWTPPAIESAVAPVRKPVKVCVVSATRHTSKRVTPLPVSKDLGLPADVARSVDQWAALVTLACRTKPQLIVTPEIAIGGRKLVEGAVAIPGPATKPFEQIARENKVHLVLGVRERAGDAIYNSAALLGPDGRLLGVYHKVHLATGEGFSGVSPGDGFPVFPTAIGRIGCLICMDTTVCESARMLALNGAEFICFPIMGDLRADRFSAGPPVYNEDRWKAIMRTRAIDNQLCMVVARNDAQGSCIIDRKGEILAWNEGDREVIEATLPADDGYRVWNGGDFREVTFELRRPHLYGAYTDQSQLRPLK